MEKVQLITLFISFILPIPLSALLLMATSRIFDLENKSYKTALKVLTFSGFIGFIFSMLLDFVETSAISATFSTDLVLVLSVIILFSIFVIPTVLLIKHFYKLEWKKTFSVSIVWLIFHLLLMFIVISPIWAIASFIFSASDPSMM